MAAQTGRTLPRFVTVKIDDSVGTLRTLTTINRIGGVRLDYPTVDLVAWSDAIRGVLLDTPNFSTTIGGVFAAGNDHTYLTGIAGLLVPLSFDIQFGIRQTYNAGEPQFGITSSASDGVLVASYNVNPEDMSWEAVIVMAAGSAAPAWGTAAET